ncbi:hypothetical protein L1887_60953 [Cichorium endivia]|nr:hypothetical protein L1887_60953 [Cichorium endivia]
MQKNLAIFKERKRRQIEQQLREEALAILQVSVARIDSLSFLKFFAATVNNILARMYHQGIHISVPQYDSVIESETYVSELLGKPKEAESLLGLLSGSSSLLQLKMGRIDIRFDTPWSLQGFIKEQKDRRAAPGYKDEKVELDPDAACREVSSSAGSSGSERPSSRRASPLPTLVR